MTTLNHTPEQLKAMLDAATGGEWAATTVITPEGKELMAVLSVPSPSVYIEIVESPDALNGECIQGETDEEAKANHILIAASRKIAEDCIALHERVEELEDMNAGLEAACDSLGADIYAIHYGRVNDEN